MNAQGAATLPPPDLPDLDPAWSRLVTVPEPVGSAGAGEPRTFHVLDSWATAPDRTNPLVTLLCVHGNPTWSYLWRRLVAAAPDGWRVVAPDQLGMGYSDRPGEARTLSRRVDDLGRLTEQLDIRGPVVLVGHDWGGMIGLGWALQHTRQLRGVVLMNTAVHQPESVPGPLLIRLASRDRLTDLVCRWTPLFVRTATALSRPRLPPEVRAAFAAPYRSSRRRAAVAQFVSDVPFAADHPSRAAIDDIADRVRDLQVPTLLLWGPRDPVFGEAHLSDLQQRLPQASVQRYERAGHLLPEDAPQYAEAVVEWVGSRNAAHTTDPALSDQHPSAVQPTSSVQPGEPAGTSAERPALAAFDARSADPAVAVIEPDGNSISWADLHRRVARLAAGLAAAGVRPGDRVALLVEPSIDLTAAVYAVWRAGAVIVIADKGLGIPAMGRALRSAHVAHVIAGAAGLLAAGPMRLPGTRIAVHDVAAPVRALVHLDHTVTELNDLGADGGPLPEPAPGAEAAVLFTSGATGPAKGVRYLQHQVAAQLELIRRTYRLTADDRIVAAFAPFALYGPALGIPSAVPDCDVTKPATLTAALLGDATARIGGTVVFASPAALNNVLVTAALTTTAQRRAMGGVRLLISAGAPVPTELLERLRVLFPAADIHTPYGMTEALPVTDVSLDQILEAGPGDGVCVGYPVEGISIKLAPLDARGEPGRALTDQCAVTGELWVRGPHIRDSYDSLWSVDHAAADHPGWHRTGDVGMVDAAGRWWIQGRLAHVVRAATGPIAPVGIEQRVLRALTRHRAYHRGLVAAVGVGPAGAQQLVVVLSGPDGPLAPAEVADDVRRAAAAGSTGLEVAAVLVRRELPVDIRHNSKIDRIAVAAWADKVLAGR